MNRRAFISGVRQRFCRPFHKRLTWTLSASQENGGTTAATVPDYVLFPHQAHIQAKIACQECHGPLRERDTIIKEKPTTMKFCVDCHTRSLAPVACDTCHAPNP